MRIAIFILSLLVILIFLSITPVHSFSEKNIPTPTTPPEPQLLIAWMISNHPWHYPLGFIPRTFALYDDGLVIYTTKNGYYSVYLSEDELTAWLEPLPIDDFMKLDEFYNVADGATDMPEHMLAVWQGDQSNRVSVYGDPEIPEIRENFPEPFPGILEAVSNFEHGDAEPWLPDQIEVTFLPAEMPIANVPPWPDSWPLPPHLVDKEYASPHHVTYLDGEYLERFMALMEEVDYRVIAHNKAWLILFRFPLPSETLWLDG